MKYLIAGVVAATLILGMFLFNWSVDSEIRELFKAHGLDTQDLEDYGTELTSGQLLRRSIADSFTNYRWALSILIFGTSFGIASLCGNSARPIENEKPTVNEGPSSA